MGIVLLEVIIVAIIVLIVSLCYKKGKINLIVGGLVVLVTIILAVILYKPISNQFDESILSKETIKRLKKLDENITIEIINLSNYVEFAKEYEKVSNKITVEEIEYFSDREDLQDKYDMQPTDEAIIIKNGEKFKMLDFYDLYTVEFETYKHIDLTEEAITNAIMGVTIKNKPKVYVLTGKTYYEPEKCLKTILSELNEEEYQINNLNISKTKSVPEDCDCLIITTLKQDLSTFEKNEILEYINNGGKILMLTSQNTLEINTPNLDEVLEQYGITIDYGMIIEQDANKKRYEQPSYIFADAKANFLNEFNMPIKIYVAYAGKIQFANGSELEKLGVTYETIAKTDEKAFVRTNFDITSEEKTDGDSDEGVNIFAARVSKNISKEKTSELIIYSNELFASDIPIDLGTYTALINVNNNKDIILQSVAYLTEREDRVIIRKWNENE